MSITAWGQWRASAGMIPRYMSTLVCTTPSYDCSLLHALAVTTTTADPADADRSDRREAVKKRRTNRLKRKLVQLGETRQTPIPHGPIGADYEMDEEMAAEGFSTFGHLHLGQSEDLKVTASTLG